MYTRNQKHVPKNEVAPPKNRQVEFPQRVDKSSVEAGFSLGFIEPEDGRYNTTSRKTYTYETPSEKPEPRATIIERKGKIELDHRSRHFYLGSPLPYTSENRTALAPPPVTSFDPPSLQNRKNAIAMNTAHFFMRDGDSHPTSTLRGDFKACGANTIQQMRAEAALCRAEQQKTNYALGDQKNTWSSEARANYGKGKGAGGVATSGGEYSETKKWLPVIRNTPSPLLSEEISQPKRAANKNLISQFTLGSSDLADKEGIKSLKQVDFVPHAIVSSLNKPNQVDAQRDMFVFGHRGVPINSLYRESFPPTQFATNPSPTPARKL
eukprot:GILI01001031.1.p1 GENE.GILI01001031.1~~GILI01001031.1.p1  ORF type:complete len:330 (+),score=15.48 GILI01001031.1:24-992(+)